MDEQSYDNDEIEDTRSNSNNNNNSQGSSPSRRRSSASRRSAAEADENDQRLASSGGSVASSTKKKKKKKKPSSGAASDLSRLEQDALSKSRARPSRTSGGTPLNPPHESNDAIAKNRARRQQGSSRPMTPGATQENVAGGLNQMEADLMAKNQARPGRNSAAAAALRNTESDVLAKSRAVGARPGASLAAVDPAARKAARHSASSQQSRSAASAAAAQVQEPDDDEEEESGGANMPAPNAKSYEPENAGLRSRVPPPRGAAAAVDLEEPPEEDAPPERNYAATPANQNQFNGNTREVPQGMNDPEMVGGSPPEAYPTPNEPYSGAAPDGEDGGIEAFVADTVVDAAGVAVVLSEEEEEKLEQKRFRMWLGVGGLVFIAVAAIVVTIVVIFVGGNNEPAPLVPTSVPSMTPSMSPTLAPTTARLNSIISRVLPLSPDPSVFTNLSSPQYQAALWVSDEDLLRLPTDSPRLVQRYLLAVFYFAMDGDTWVECGRPDTICGGNPDDFTWLYGTESECDWLGLNCNSAGQVHRIFFRK